MDKKSRRKGRVGRTNSSDERTGVYILIDNVPEGIAGAFSRSETYVVTKEALGFSQSVSDEELISEFCEVVTESAGNGIVFTQDRGKGDKIMPKQMAIHRRSSRGKIMHVTTSIKGRQNILKASRALKNKKGFKDESTYATRYKTIHLSMIEKENSLRITYERSSGKKGYTDIPGVFS